MIDHQRQWPRYTIDDAVDVYDNLRDLYLGRLVNINTHGLMVMGDQPLDEDKLYKLDLHLPQALSGRNSIHLGVDCLWTRNADHNGKHWSGFNIIDASPQAREDIEILIQQLGQPTE